MHITSAINSLISFAGRSFAAAYVAGVNSLRFGTKKLQDIARLSFFVPMGIYKLPLKLLNSVFLFSDFLSQLLNLVIKNSVSCVEQGKPNDLIWWI